MILPPFLRCAAALACGALAPAAMAQDAGGPSVAFSGFATLGVVQTDTNLGTYNHYGQTNGATKNAAFGVDSKLGVQANAKLNSMFSATGQLLTYSNEQGNSEPKVSWLFGKAQINSNVAVRAGRMGFPVFMVSDFRDVNYANTWVRPPIEVYGQVIPKTFDGADVLLQGEVGPASVSAQFFTGSTKAYYARTPIDLKKQLGFNVTAEFDVGLSLRLGHVQGKLSINNSDLTALFGGISQTPFAQVARELEAVEKDVSFSGFGFTLDRADWVVSSEYTRRKTKSYIADTSGWYVSVGHRFGSLTPYGVVSQLKVDNNNVVSTIPGGIAPVLDFLKANVEGLVATQDTRQKTVALGLRWDARKNTAFKVQYDRVKPGGSGGLFYSPNAQLPGKTVQVFSLSADVVF